MSTNLDTRNVTVGEAAPAEPRTEAQITADLERQRAELAATIDQLYARVQPAALAQEAKEEASARFASFKQSASLTLQDAAGGNAEAIKKVGVVALSAVGAIGVIVLLATRSSRPAAGPAALPARPPRTRFRLSSPTSPRPCKQQLTRTGVTPATLASGCAGSVSPVSWASAPIAPLR